MGPAPDLRAMENRIGFVLRSGSHPDGVLQAAWNATAGEGFTFKVLELLDPELSAMAQAGMLEERSAHWRARLAESVKVRSWGKGRGDEALQTARRSSPRLCRKSGVSKTP